MMVRGLQLNLRHHMERKADKENYAELHEQEQHGQLPYGSYQYAFHNKHNDSSRAFEASNG